MNPAETTDAAERATKLAAQLPAALAAVVFAAAFFLVLWALLKERQKTADLLVSLVNATGQVANILDRTQRQRRAPRRTTNPGLKPPEPGA